MHWWLKLFDQCMGSVSFSASFTTTYKKWRGLELLLCYNKKATPKLIMIMFQSCLHRFLWLLTGVLLLSAYNPRASHFEVPYFDKGYILTNTAFWQGLCYISTNARHSDPRGVKSAVSLNDDVKTRPKKQGKSRWKIKQRFVVSWHGHSDLGGEGVGRERGSREREEEEERNRERKMERM